MERSRLSVFLLALAAVLLWTVALSPVSAAQEDSLQVPEGLDYGLHIVSYPAHADAFTGLALEDGKEIPVRGKKLDLSFDLYNRTDNVFGCIFRIITDKGENVDLMYTADLDDSRKPILVTGEQVHQIGTDIPLEEWIHVSVALDTKTGQIDLDQKT